MLEQYSLKLFYLIYYQSNENDFGIYKPCFTLNAILSNWLEMLLMFIYKNHLAIFQ